MSRFNVILIGVLALPGALFCMENKQLSSYKQSKVNKWSSKSFDSLKNLDRHNFSEKPLIAKVDRPNSLDRFRASSIQDVRQDVKENPEEWVQFFKFSHGKHVDTLKPLLYCSDEQLGKFGSVLGLDKQHTGKIFTMPFGNVLKEINTLQTFQKNRTKKLPLNDLIKMSSDQIEIVGHLDNHFTGNVAVIDIDRNRYDLVVSFPQQVKNVFRNDKEFYTARLMRFDADKLVHMGIETAKGIVIDAGPG